MLFYIGWGATKLLDYLITAILFLEEESPWCFSTAFDWGRPRNPLSPLTSFLKQSETLGLVHYTLSPTMSSWLQWSVAFKLSLRKLQRKKPKRNLHDFTVRKEELWQDVASILNLTERLSPSILPLSPQKNRKKPKKTNKGLCLCSCPLFPAWSVQLIRTINWSMQN